MFAVCLEASHQRGLGHLFRQLSLVAHFIEQGAPFVVLVNDYAVAHGILRAHGIPFETVPLAGEPGWESPLIRRLGITTWINDRLDTGGAHAAAVKNEGIHLATFDDRGEGAALSDLHIAALCIEDSEKLTGKRVVTGMRYLVLDRSIERFRRLRSSADRILVTLGGTDTYGVTVRAVELLKRVGRGATVVLGPGFRHLPQLQSVVSPAFEIKQSVKSLIEEFARHDVAITGGGMTPFEASASGLPCVIVANEWFEVPLAKYLEGLGCSIFAGHHSEIEAIPLPTIRDVEAMSRAGMAQIDTRGAENVYRELVRP